MPTPEESWLYLLKNMATFAGKPEEMGSKYAVVAEASRMHRLPDAEQIQYLFAMVYSISAPLTTRTVLLTGRNRDGKKARLNGLG